MEQLLFVNMVIFHSYVSLPEGAPKLATLLRKEEYYMLQPQHLMCSFSLNVRIIPVLSTGKILWISKFISQMTISVETS